MANVTRILLRLVMELRCPWPTGMMLTHLLMPHIDHEDGAFTSRINFPYRLERYNLDINIDEADIFNWDVSINRIISARITFPPDYPRSPPEIREIPQITYPNRFQPYLVHRGFRDHEVRTAEPTIEDVLNFIIGSFID